MSRKSPPSPKAKDPHEDLEASMEPGNQSPLSGIQDDRDDEARKRALLSPRLVTTKRA